MYIDPNGKYSIPGRDPNTVTSVGTGFHRDLPPTALVPDPSPPPPKASEGHPAEVQYRDSPLGLIYVDRQGKSLYQLRVPGQRTRGAPEKYCQGPCAKTWLPLLAPADANAVGAWHVVAGVSGPQWAYGRFPVYTYADDKAPGDLGGHEFEDIFFAINYIPPVPTIKTPANVTPLLANFRDYVLADTDGRTLYSFAGEKGCAALCEKLVPFTAGMGSRQIGDWSVARQTDRPQWAYKGRLVYVDESKSAEFLDPSAVLRP
jgi:predicted lipoprotein with Yx(FWY)xxD motif